MKKLVLTAMIAALLVLPLESVAVAQTPDSTTPGASQSQGQDYVPGGVPAQTGAVDSMTPAIHAMVMAMVNHGNTVYNSSDTQLGWETLYNMLSLYGQLDERSDYVGEDLLLPSETVMDYAAALPNGAGLGSLPGGLTDRMTYDARSDSYHVACGNDSLAEVQLGQATQQSGSLLVTGRLVYVVDNSTLTQFQVVLQPRDNMFGYTITAMELL